MLRRYLASLFGVVLLASMLPNVAFAENYCINPFQYGPGRIQITLTPSGFDPSTVTVPLGTELNWLNCTGIDATVNSDPHPTHEFWNWLNLGAWPGDGSAVVQVIPPSTGIFTYHNHYNPSQTGTLIVTAHGKTSQDVFMALNPKLTPEESFAMARIFASFQACLLTRTPASCGTLFVQLMLLVLAPPGKVS